MKNSTFIPAYILLPTKKALPFREALHNLLLYNPLLMLLELPRRGLGVLGFFKGNANMKTPQWGLGL